MRISDWSSDVCSSDLGSRRSCATGSAAGWPKRCTLAAGGLPEATTSTFLWERLQPRAFDCAVACRETLAAEAAPTRSNPLHSCRFIPPRIFQPPLRPHSTAPCPSCCSPSSPPSPPPRPPLPPPPWPRQRPPSTPPPPPPPPR